MKQTEKYLAVYKDYETALRDAGIDPKAVEDAIDEVTAGRLRICRQMRNYLAHNNDPGFLEISDGQIRFLEGRLKEQKMSGDIAKKHMKPASACICSMEDRCTAALEKMKKNKATEIMVTTGSDIRIATCLEVASGAVASKTTKLKDVKLQKARIVYTRPDMKIDSLPKGVHILCTDTGEKDGKILGEVFL